MSCEMIPAGWWTRLIVSHSLVATIHVGLGYAAGNLRPWVR